MNYDLFSERRCRLLPSVGRVTMQRSLLLLGIGLRTTGKRVIHCREPAYCAAKIVAMIDRKLVLQADCALKKTNKAITNKMKPEERPLL